MASLDQLLQVIVKEGGSDLHIGEGQPPKMRKHGDIAPIREKLLARDETMSILREVCGERNWEIFEERGDLDFAYEMDAASRFRCNYLKQAHGYGAVFRLIPTKIATLEELGIPIVAKEFADLRGGLVLVTGPTGSGKSTTLASLIDYINDNFSRHIVTIEEPIEFVHGNKRSIITQREVPGDSESFPVALKAALREDADIVLVGEMRDLETAEIALEAAETGHLVLSTLHTIDASKTIDRVIGLYPKNEERIIRTRLAQTFRYIVSQRLIPRGDGKGRVAAVEILRSNPRTREYIEKGESEGKTLLDAIRDGEIDGMQDFDSVIRRLIEDKVITLEDGLSYATNQNNLLLQLKGLASTEDYLKRNPVTPVISPPIAPPPATKPNSVLDMIE